MVRFSRAATVAGNVKRDDGPASGEDHMAKLAIVATAEIAPGRMDEGPVAGVVGIGLA